MQHGDEQRIRHKAYEIWEQEGRPEGRHDDHWHEARKSFKERSANEKNARSEQKSDAMQASAAADEASGQAPEGATLNEPAGETKRAAKPRARTAKSSAVAAAEAELTIAKPASPRKKKS